jgi:hypothetical protein
MLDNFKGVWSESFSNKENVELMTAISVTAEISCNLRFIGYVTKKLFAR